MNNNIPSVPKTRTCWARTFRSPIAKWIVAFSSDGSISDVLCAWSVCVSSVSRRNAAPMIRHILTFLMIRSGGCYAGQTSSPPDLKGIATACCTLGVIQYQRGDYSKAVSSFERLFEISRSIEDRSMTDCARFNLGASRGALRISAYMDVVADDLPKLLTWKLGRKDIF